MTVLWVAWHRLRRHRTVAYGWRLWQGNSERMWWCLTCDEEACGRAPTWLSWREQG